MIGFDSLLFKAGLTVTALAATVSMAEAQYRSAFRVELSKIGAPSDQFQHPDKSIDAYSTNSATQPKLYIAQPEIAGNQYAEESDVFFEHNSSALTKAQMATLDKVVAFLQNNPTARVHCAAHTDTSGDAAHNAWLAEKRNEAVTNYLAGKGISLDRLALQLESFGEDPDHLSVKTGDGVKNAQNRKVKITFTHHALGQEIINRRFIYISDKSPTELTITDEPTPSLKSIAERKLGGYNFNYQTVPGILLLDPSASSPRKIHLELKNDDAQKRITFATLPLNGAHPKCRVSVKEKSAVVEVQNPETKAWSIVYNISSNQDLSKVKIADVGANGEAAWRNQGQEYEAGSGVVTKPTGVTPTQLVPNYTPQKPPPPPSPVPGQKQNSLVPGVRN